MAVDAQKDREEWMQQLHSANERARVARVEWEKWLDATEYRHQERVDTARAKLEEAEREVESIEGRIAQEFRQMR